MANVVISSTIDEAYGGLVEREGKFAKRVVFAVHRMYIKRIHIYPRTAH